MKKRIFCIILVICLVCILQPGTVYAAGEQIKVNGIDILNAPDQMVSCGSGTASYDPGTKTLTLNNAVIDKDSNGNALINGIEIQGEGITVELTGNNTISAHCGIQSSSPLNIKGMSGGSLTIRAAQALSTQSCRGISITGGGLTVRDANLEIILSEIGNASGYALYITGGDNLISNSHIKITAQSESSSDDDIKRQGINATGAESVTISDNSSVIMENLDSGIGAYGADVVILGSSLSIVDAEDYAISCKNLEISNGAEVDTTVKTKVAIGADDNIVVSGSTVHIESKHSNALACENLEVRESSDVTAKGYWPAFFVRNNTIIEGSSIETESTNDVGIFCKGPVEIGESEVKAIGGTGQGSILAHGNISITGGKTEIGDGSISSRGDINIGGIITSNGKPSYDNIKSDTGKMEFQDADYSEVDNAIAKAEAVNKDDYENFEEVENAIQAVVRGKDIREQDVVDGYAAAIEAAIASLKPVSSGQNVYNIVEGADQTVVIGSNKDVTIKADGDFNKFSGVYIDGEEVAKENYTAVSGSTVVTLKAAYVNTLSAGTHTVTVNYTDGKAETKLTLKEDQEEGSTQDPSENESEDESKDESKDKPKDESKNPSQNQANTTKSSPRTGDYLPIGWIIILISSVVIGLATVRYRMKIQDMK